MFFFSTISFQQRCLFIHLLVAFWACIPATSHSQNILPEVCFIQYTEKDGIPSAETYDIIHDSKGYLWIGTDKGAVQYDGHHFNVFTTEDGLTDNAILKVVEDARERIWFITYNRKLCYYENGTVRPYRFNEELHDALKDSYVGKAITFFEVDRSGNVTLELGSQYAKTWNRVSISTTGNVHISTSLSKVALSAVINKKMPAEPTIQALLPIITAQYGTQKIIEVVDGQHYHFKQVGTSVFVGSPDGVRRYSVKGGKLEQHFLHDYFVTGFCEDFEGGLWCTTLYQGVIYIPRPEMVYYDFSRIDARQTVRGLLPTQTEVLVSFKQPTSSFFRLNEQKTIVPYPTVPSYNELDVHVARTGIRMEHPTELSPFSGTILTGAWLSERIFLNGQSSIRLKKETLDDQRVFRTIRDYDVPKVYRVFRDLAGTLWIGTIDGLYYLDTVSLLPKQLPAHLGFHAIRIQDIQQSKDSTLIIAARGSGLYFLQNGSVVHITKKDGLLSNTINTIWYDWKSDLLWVATNKGITALRYAALHKNVTIFHRLSIHEGFPSPDIMQVFLRKDTLYYTTKQGMGFIPGYTPERLSDRTAPILYLDSLTVNGRTRLLTPSLRLNHDENNFHCYFHAISFKSGTDLRYSYRLSGIDPTWIESSARQLHYNSLPPGAYTLEIRATSSSGVVSTPLTLSFTIEKAFWMTTWFRVLIVLLILGIVAFIIKIIRDYYRYHLRLERTVNELKNQALQAKMNPHFIFNALNSVQNYILRNEKKKANRYLLDFSRLMRLILQNSDSTSVLLIQELEALRIYVSLERDRLRADFQYEEQIDPDIDLDHCIIPSLLIQPYIENAIWHGQLHTLPDGKVTLSIQRNEKKLFFQIVDNGIGVSASRRQKKGSVHSSYGTTINQSRIELLSKLHNELTEIVVKDAYIDDETNVAYGTIVTFSIPYVTQTDLT